MEFGTVECYLDVKMFSMQMITVIFSHEAQITAAQLE
jgi:hypothetical protein